MKKQAPKMGRIRTPKTVRIVRNHLVNDHGRREARRFHQSIVLRRHTLFHLGRVPETGEVVEQANEHERSEAPNHRIGDEPDNHFAAIHTPDKNS